MGANVHNCRLPRSIALGIAEIVYGGMVGGLGGIIRIVAGLIIPVYLTRSTAEAYFAKAILDSRFPAPSRVCLNSPSDMSGIIPSNALVG